MFKDFSIRVRKAPSRQALAGRGEAASPCSSPAARFTKTQRAVVGRGETTEQALLVPEDQRLGRM